MHKLGLALATIAFIGCGSDDGNKGSNDTDRDAEPSDSSQEVQDTSDTLQPIDTFDARDTSDTASEDGDDADIEPGTFGSPCNQNKDCLSGWCVTSDNGPLCTRQCQEDCPSGWSCLGIAGQVDVTFLCVPRQDRLCQPCFIDDQCNNGYCLTFEDGQRCSAACKDDEDCPSGYTCETSQSEAVSDERSTQCVPVNDTCACLPSTAGLQEPCNNTTTDGTCWGLRTCLGADGWSACTAPTPEPEVCDGLDNNCNLFTDETVLGAGAPCDIHNEFGQCSGIQRCEGESGFVCVAPTPAAEACNYQDDDCDGMTDEGFADLVSGLYVGDANCGVCGNSCDGFFPNAVSACADVQGTARCVVKVCDSGYYQAGPTTCLPVLDASCLPCTEDTNCVVPGNACVPLDGAYYCAQDCAVGNLNGLPAGTCKSGYACTALGDGRNVCLPETASCACLVAADDGKTRPCTNTNPFGTCAGSQTCDADGGGFSTCTARVPSGEICNGIDDDCDGVVDESAPPPPETCARTNSFGTCEGAWACGGVNGWICTANEPAADICNRRDDNCDGATDEDYVDAASGLYLTRDDCGLCGRDCDDVILFSSATECRLEAGLPTCVATACQADFYIPPDTNRVCIPTSGAASCSPCADDAQCAELVDGRCTSIDGGKFCTAGCSQPEDCDDGYDCLEGRCLPSTLSCTCRAGLAGNLRPCVRQTTAGTCTGVETCDPDATPGWSDCSAPEPVAETCNGVDDNCNGRVDENLEHTPSGCTAINDSGTCIGTYRCEGANGWQCPVEVPRAETCNFADDNCDSNIDETFRDASNRYIDDENCGTCGNSCVGLLPNASAHCVAPAGTGQPRCEVASCNDGYYQVGKLTCLPAQDTTCIPCVTDGNCPTPGDKCLPLDGGHYCGRDCAVGNVHGLPPGQCDDGFECYDFGNGTAQCIPMSGSCSCLDEDRDAIRTCKVTNGSGTCFGTEVCAPENSWGGCTAATPDVEVCNGVDDDCDGRVDEDVVAPVEACQIDNAAGTCSATWVCAAAQGWVCDAKTPALEACNGVDDDCEGGVDENFRDASGIYNDLLNCGACGISCVGAIPNATAACVVRGAAARCEVASCGPGYYRASDLTCLPASNNSCFACSSDASCPTPGDKCLTLDGGSFCGRDCSAGNNHGTPTGQCDAGYVCSDVVGGGRQCVPQSGSCACRAGDAGKTRTCRIQNVSGTCFGSESCDPSAGWIGCDAETPETEVCDGEDNDCDGLTDESVSHDPTTCDNVVAGVGTCTGNYICQAELGWQCPVKTPLVEACDFLDNDCDGATDETYRNVNGLYVSDTNCGSCGISCNGAIPNATAVCAVGPNGQPRCEVGACNDGYYKAGALSCASASSNLCAPCGANDTCPTPGDRCLTSQTGAKYCGQDCSAGNVHGTTAGVCTSGYTCTTIAGGPNQCVPNSGTCDCLPENAGATRTCQAQNTSGTCFGTEICDPASGWVGCTARLPSDELCNGIDDNCNGQIDEAVSHSPTTCSTTVAGVGTCSANYTCGGAASWQCTPATPLNELCNGLDDDCDSAVDENFKNAQGLYVNLNNCGACGVSCVGAIPNATATCSANNGSPRCEVASCQSGYYLAGPLTCLPAVDNSCAPCATDANCRTPGDKCLSLDGGKYCGRDCAAGNVYGTSAGACPSGFACQDFGAARQCMPLSQSCTCLADDVGDERSCVAQNPNGTCFGTATCDPNSGWSTCSARTPSVETCNTVDDDCDTVIDDVAGRGDACSIGNGFGTCNGVKDCVTGQSSPQCIAATPAAETCNSRDDDCDGATDETFTINQSCSNGNGACQRFGFTVCTAQGNGVTCNATAGTATTEICDGIDNDCDGGTDETNWPNKGQPCTLGQGVCQVTGVYVCSANGSTTQCSVSPPAAAVQTEVGLCNNLDDNCNGAIDEYFTTKGQICSVGTGICTRSGNFACNAQGNDVTCNATAGSGTSEACDLLDNDCDGTTDEDFKNAGGTKYDKTTTCGNCFTNCTSIYSGRANAFGTCDATPATPTCVMSCNSSFFNLNAVPDDGCEFGLDNTAIYVGTSSSGAVDDATCGLGPVGTGGTNHPCKTIAQGLTRANALTRTKVIVADGLYVEQVTLRNGISLLGGYRADTWERHLSSTATTIRGNTPAASTHTKTIIAASITSATVLEGFLIYGETNFHSSGNSYAVYVTNSNSSLTIRNNLVFAGDGGDTDPGASGSQGGTGNTGKTGSNWVSTDEYSNGQCLNQSGIPANQGTAGDGGTNTCSSSSTRGGDGGAATCPVNNTQQSTGATGSAVAGNAAAGTGGVGGYDWYTTNQNGGTCGIWQTGGKVHDGRNGNNGGNGTFGTPGAGCAVASNKGAVSATTLEWGGSAGTSGAAGKHGGGGGGGGAGGGADVVTSSCHPDGSNGDHDSVGGSGGGGGAGGCGATGGGGGAAGGGAFGVFIAYTSASAALPVLSGNIFTPGNGGSAGNGGLAGAGGLGGDGGSGGITGGAFPSIMGPGGRGGQGGDGGHGGGGGGGCGGVSYSIYVFNNASAPNYHQAAQANTFASGGVGGAGGIGGSSIGNTGTNGVDGSSGSYNY